MMAEPVCEKIEEQELIPAARKTRTASPTPIQIKTFLLFSKNSLILSDTFSPSFLPVFFVAVPAV